MGQGAWCSASSQRWTSLSWFLGLGLAAVGIFAEAAGLRSCCCSLQEKERAEKAKAAADKAKAEKDGAKDADADKENKAVTADGKGDKPQSNGNA